MPLFGRTSEASVSRRVAEASALCDRGRVQEGRKRLEKLVAEAQKALGADNEETLFAREALAMSYAYDAPERGLQLIDVLLAEYERVFGKESRELLILRGHLPGLYGLSGDHEKALELAAALIPDSERVFGRDADETREMRENVRYAEEQIAQAELDRLLAIASEPAPHAAATDELKERARQAADGYESASSYRSRLVLKSGEGRDEGEIQWRFEYVRPDKLHVLQLAREEGEQLADEWIVLGNERYQNAGLWFKREDDLNANINQFLLADKCLKLLRTGVPVSTSAAKEATSRYLVLEYDATPDAVIEFLSADEPLERARGRTRAWIDTSTETLARVDVSLSAHSKAEGDLHVDASQGYTSYEAEIGIEAPEVQ